MHGAHPGPAPAHDVEIWLGAYKRRMLALTGRKADGWLPSMGYADPPELAAKNAAIDEAAAKAGPLARSRSGGSTTSTAASAAAPSSSAAAPASGPPSWPS